MSTLLLLLGIGSIHHLSVLLLLGIAVFFGSVGARLFQKLHIPQVVGYVVIGILIGESALNVISVEAVRSLAPFSIFALGIIGFMIGGELRYEVFKKYGSQFLTIMLSEGLFAFVVVAVATTVVAGLFTNSWGSSLALGVVLGAISSATAPAATVDVLWEYKTRGILTRTILAIVALDDGLSLLLYGFASSLAGVLLGHNEATWTASILVPVWEIMGAIALGIAAGFVLIFILKYIKETGQILAFVVALLVLVVGLSDALKVESILAAMLFGVTVANFLPRRSEAVFDVVEKFAPPVYALFFVLVGARLRVFNVPLWIVILSVVYVIGRTAGKISGSWFGSVISHASGTVRRYLGLCLFSQAGVAVGLSILASRRFGGDIGEAIILIIATTTFVVQIIGPPCVKLAVKKAGEIGMNVTEEELIKTYAVKDVMDTEPTTIAQDLPLRQILKEFSTSDSLYYPVVDNRCWILGIITIASIKGMFANEKFAGWLLACDVAEPVMDKTMPDKPLEEALERMRRYDLAYMPVVAGENENNLLGILDYRKTMRKISAEVLHRRQLADQKVVAGG